MTEATIKQKIEWNRAQTQRGVERGDALLSDHTLPSMEKSKNLVNLELLREQVYHTWLPKWDETIDGLPAQEWFAKAESEGNVCFRVYTPQELRGLQDHDRLYWKEECHYADALKSITLPRDPGRSFKGMGEGPLVFVRHQEREAVIVVNGNHRTGAVMSQELNPMGSPLFAVVFSSAEVYEKFAGMPLSPRSYLAIPVVEGDRPR